MIKAVQIDPAYQDPCLDDYVFDDISVFGNRHFNEHLQPVVEMVRDAVKYGELISDINNLQHWTCPYMTATEAINDIIPAEKKNGKGYSTRDIHAIKAILGNPQLDDEDVITALLSIVTGTEWEYKCIRGCCQGDWNYAYYRKEDFPNGIDEFEVEYFNTGSEWLVDDELSVYCHSWRDEDIATEIADAYGCAAGDIELVHWN